MTQPDAGESPDVTLRERIARECYGPGETEAPWNNDEEMWQITEPRIREMYLALADRILALPELQRALGTQGEPERWTLREPEDEVEASRMWAAGLVWLQKNAPHLVRDDHSAFNHLLLLVDILQHEINRLYRAAPATPAVQAVEIVREYQRAAERLGTTIAAVTAHQIGNAIERECKSAPAGPEPKRQIVGDCDITDLPETSRRELLVHFARKYDSPRNWTEDFPHENGGYQNTCIDCGRQFLGHKRRVVCRVCAGESQSAPAGDTQPAVPLSVQALLHKKIDALYKIADGLDELPASDLRLVIYDLSDIADSLARVAVPRDANDALREALTTAGAWFYEYGLTHSDKGNQEKARRNFERSKFCRQAIAASLTPQTSVPQPEGETHG